MRRLALLGAAIGVLLGSVNLTGALAAGEKPGKPSPPGQEQTPPGQAAKAEADREKATPPGQEQVPPGQAAKTTAAPTSRPVKPDHHGHEHAEAEPASAKPSTHEKRISPSHARSDAVEPKHVAKPSKLSPANGNSAVAHTHVIICHRTGSKSNPYVVINISISAWLHGHATHPSLNGHNDILLKQGAKPGEKMPRSACGAAGDTTTTTPPRTTAPTKATGAVPSSNTPPSPPAVGPRDPSAPVSPGGARGSHDGNDASVAAQVAEAAVASELPFTGMPVWVALLAGFWLIGSGLALRKAFARPSEEVSRSSDQFTW